jgi:hypothetical protein
MRLEDPPFGKLEMVSVLTNLSHVTDVTMGNGKKVAIPSLEEPTLGTARGLIDWKNRFMPVLVPSVYSKTEWVRRRLVPKEFSAVLDIPADVARAATLEMQETWIKRLTVPIKDRSEVLGMVERFFEGTAPVKRDLDQIATTSEVPERKKSRANSPASSHEGTSTGPETAAEGPTIAPTSPGSTDGTKTLIASDDSLLESDLKLTEADRLGRTAKASKADNARVPEYLWDDRIMLSPKACGVGRDELLAALQVIRRGVLRFWKRSVAVSFYEWWKREL